MSNNSKFCEVFIGKNIEKTKKANFASCFFDELHIEEAQTFGNFNFSSNRIQLYLDESKEKIPLAHAPKCPISCRETKSNQTFQQWENVLDKQVKLAVCVLVENIDTSTILLTRRNKNLRLFPSTWVIAGGHIDPDETPVQAGIREIKEETSIEIDTENCKPFALYESCFPITVGEPIAQHLIVYYKCDVKNDQVQNLKFEEDEVDAACWLGIENLTLALENKGANETFDLIFPENEKFSLSQLHFAPDEEGNYPQERLATGVVFVLKEWLKTKM